MTCLSKIQDSEGGFSSWGTTNSESVVQVIVGLCELGISLEDRRFVKNGYTLVDNLFTFRKADGSFIHTKEGAGSDQIASEQGFYAIVAIERSLDGKNSLYRMNDCTIKISGIASEMIVGLPGKHADVQKVNIVNPGKTFEDISAHDNQPAIEALIARGIINGMGDDSFAPDKTMTRAQFATIVVKSLGLAPKSVECFADVPKDAWYTPYIGTAYSYGLINGRSESIFDHNGTITRQEAATLVARAAKLCGMDTEMQSYEILNMLAQFSDYITISDWARGSVAFCYSENILAQSDLNVEPTKAILRCEIAQMLYNMLLSANLL